jgi:rhamnulokinase
MRGEGYMKRHIAVDIGASSGRLILGFLQQNKIVMEEIHRFENKMFQEKEHYFWDIDHLFTEILEGLKKLPTEADGEKSLTSIGVDTWAVDYVLVNSENKRVAPVYAYRDHRTDATMEKVFAQMAQDKVYAKTGIQFQQFNTIYQLFEHVRQAKEDIDRATTLMMVPDYLNFLLSGKKTIEYTNATSTQLLDAVSCDWDEDLLTLVGVKKELFETVTQPGTILGGLTPEVEAITGLKETQVIAPATHDTGSAVVSVPAVDKGFAYISSGTWSLMGIESDVPVCTPKAFEYNFTNEGGVFGTYRVLKNIMGLWIIQEVKRLYSEDINFADIVKEAEKSEPFYCLIDPNAARFLNPTHMIEEIQAFCEETQQPIPRTIGQLGRCVFESLAFAYRGVLDELKDLQPENCISKIYIIGGGAKNSFLNQITADFTGCVVSAGPYEATAIGNLVMQMITAGTIESLSKARGIIKESFEIEYFEPYSEKIGTSEKEVLESRNTQKHDVNRSQSKIEENWIKFRRLTHVK